MAQFVCTDPEPLGDNAHCDLDKTVYRERGGSNDPDDGEGGRFITTQRGTVIVQIDITPSPVPPLSNLAQKIIFSLKN